MIIAVGSRSKILFQSISLNCLFFVYTFPKHLISHLPPFYFFCISNPAVHLSVPVFFPPRSPRLSLHPSSRSSTLRPKINKLYSEACQLFVQKTSQVFGCCSALGPQREARLQIQCFFTISPSVFHFSWSVLLYPPSVQLSHGLYLLCSLVSPGFVSFVALSPLCLTSCSDQFDQIESSDSFSCLENRFIFDQDLSALLFNKHMREEPNMRTPVLMPLGSLCQVLLRATHINTRFSDSVAKHSQFGIFLSLTCFENLFFFFD